jgi:hypothetical protein
MPRNGFGEPRPLLSRAIGPRVPLVQIEGTGKRQNGASGSVGASPRGPLPASLPDVVAYGAGAGALAAPSGSARRLLAAMGRDAAQTEDGRYRLLVEAVTDYAIWVLILIVSHNLGLRASSRCGIGMRQIGPQRNSGVVCLLPTAVASRCCAPRGPDAREAARCCTGVRPGRTLSLFAPISRMITSRIRRMGPVRSG